MVKCLGIDVGSTYCKIALINNSNEYEFFSRKINVDPIFTVNEMIRELNINEPVKIGVTGSSKGIIAKSLKINTTKSEIISHAKATIQMIPQVTDIFEIGGQDSKYIKIKNGVVVDFRMNSVCAAGTGSFIEWQAERMGISVESFDELAMKANKTIELKGRCSVFLESAIINVQRTGEKKENIAFAICLCLANNYYNEMCKKENLGDTIVLQGGIAKMKSMKKAFEYVSKKKIIVPENCEYLGAIGIASIAEEQESKNVELSNIDLHNYEIETQHCNDCERKCELIKYYNEKDEFFVGGRCGKY